jgi:uncharacterized membrane protein
MTSTMDRAGTAAPLREQSARSGPSRPPSPWWPRASLAGTVGAIALGCLSFTPSLLPRDWLMQGAVTGISAAVGYGVGVFVAWLTVSLTGWFPSDRVRHRSWIVVGVVGVPLLGLAIWAGSGWQREVHLLMGHEPPGSYAWVRILVVSLALLLPILAVARVIRWLVRRLTSRLRRRLPDRIARALAVLLVGVLLIGVNNGLLWRGLVTVMNHTYGAADGRTEDGTTAPIAAERSGSPTSLVPWEDLGRQGQEFVANGPTVADLEAFAGPGALLPVRTYVGLRSADSTGARADLAVRELRRAGGFERSVLVVATTTGTGMVDPAAAAAVEYVHHGDTAVVGLQYSYLPSWISFLVDAERAREAGRELFNEVYDAWDSLPAGQRPALLVTGSSLGAFGAEAAFGGLADVLNRTDGVVWAGPPYVSELHARLVMGRDRGTPAWLPVYGSGETVRFAARPVDLAAPGPLWRHPRIVYLQHGSDPILYWTPRLAFSRPAWLSGTQAPDVNPAMRWIPVVTFAQVTADLAFSLEAPAGHGHHYRELFADAWAAVSAPPAWTDEDTARLHEVLGRIDG